MTHTFKLARRTARFRASLLAILALAFVGACNSADKLASTAPTEDPSAPAAVEPAADTLAITDTAGDGTGGMPIADDDPTVDDEEDTGVDLSAVPAQEASTSTTPTTLSFLSTFRGGIAYGLFHLPSSLYGKTYNGTLLNTSSSVSALVPYLAAARASGTKVVISLVGADKYYKNTDGTFSLTKWKRRVDAYRGVNFSTYINDGTIIGHYILDEPHDPTNWGGTVVSRATVDEMARYSKSIWPNMPTVIRGWPAYLKGYNYRYLDAAWAQYSARKGPIGDFVYNNVRDAKAAGLALVVGLNLLDGGTSASGIRGYTSGKYAMSPSQIKYWGGTLIANSYPCALVSWKYDATYLARSGISSALSTLSSQARYHTTKSCRGF